MSAQSQQFDITARKFHQSITVLLLVLGFVINGVIGTWLVGLAGGVMLVGRFWWPADIFRQLVWRVLEPVGILKRREVQEDHDTRRVARALGGVILLVAAALLALAQSWAWVLVGAIAIMISLDAAFDFCVLCALTYQYGKLQAQR